jgi:hypothetical protein
MWTYSTVVVASVHATNSTKILGSRASRATVLISFGGGFSIAIGVMPCTKTAGFALLLNNAFLHSLPYWEFGDIVRSELHVAGVPLGTDITVTEVYQQPEVTP